MTRKALIVGINDYAPVGPGGPDLRGCVNDARDIANTLSLLKIVPALPANMKIFTDANATRANIINGLKWLVTGAKKGDVLIFYYSGHGSQVADVSGDEIDKKDETICPHDFATAGMIKDDDLRSIFSNTAIPSGVNLDVILDSCFSGTGTRELVALSMMPEEQSITYRYIEPPLDYEFFLDATPSIPLRSILKPQKVTKNGITTKEVVVVGNLNHVLWGGCRDYQTSAEATISGVYRGIFTYCFCNALRRLGINATRRQLDSAVSSGIKALNFSQIPQLEGTLASINEKVFT